MSGRVTRDAPITRAKKTAATEVPKQQPAVIAAPTKAPEDTVGPARRKAPANLTGGRHKAVKISIPGRPDIAPLKASDLLKSLATGALAQSSPATGILAPAPSSVKAETRNEFTLKFSPAITDQNSARRAVFGSDTVPPGLSLERRDGGWMLRVEADPAKQAPNNLRWDAYQAGVRPELQAYLSKNLPANLNVPSPGKSAPVLAEYDADQRAKQVKVTGWSSGMVIAETLKGPKMIDTTSFDVDFGKKMTKEQAAQFFWDQKKVPMNSTLEAMPKGKEPASQWRVTQPEQWTTDSRAKGIHPTLGLHLLKQTNAANQKIPEWIGSKTRAALESKSLPPKGVDVKHPKPGIAVWREGNGVFWYDEKKKTFEAFPRKPGTGPGTGMWNNWNTSYIMEKGISPREAGPMVVADMHDTNRQMLMAFAQALAGSKSPEQGVIAVAEQAMDVAGKFVDHPMLKGKDDLIEAAREDAAKR
ncbi:MAG: hypothetical protein Q8L14_01715 [Myxococcales bacterium]|nr:hypothetical protein [Myxococcales bacterium]